jgi:hypothetical protein
LPKFEADRRVEVNPVVVDTARSMKDDPDPFVAEVRSRPFVDVPIGQR